MINASAFWDDKVSVVHAFEWSGLRVWLGVILGAGLDAGTAIDFTAMLQRIMALYIIGKILNTCPLAGYYLHDYGYLT